tara:strand:+ start:4401 stop:5159 length:759 start_codon:yes stop_codon:yes gene_type:complete
MNTLLGYSYQGGGEVPSSYQNGGNVSPTLAALLRKREKARSQDEYEDIMIDEAKKRESASSWGGFGSLLGSLLLPALTGATGGLGLALAAGLGSYGGKKIGSSAGYDGTPRLFSSPDSEDYSSVMEDEDLIYGKKAFEDMGKSARDYSRRGIDQDAIVSGLKSGLMAGFGGDDSIYARAGKRNLFTPQAMPTKVEPWSMGKSDFIAGAEQGDYGQFTKLKNTFGLPDYRRNLLDYMNIGTAQPFDIANPLSL